MYKHLKSFKGECSLSTWCYKVAYRVFLDAQKKKKKQQKLKEIRKNEIKHPLSVGSNIDQILDAEKVISCLRPEEKTAIQLSYIQGFSHKEISLIMDCPIGTVKSHISRGKKRIQSIYKHK